MTIVIALSFILSPALCHAFFCPSNFNQIDFGDSTDHVKTQCGKPDKEEEKEVEAQGPQEWSYFIPQTVALSANQLGQGTLKTTITFDKNGKAINISVNGIGVGGTQICGNTTNIKLGDTRDAVKAACGEPAFVNKEANANALPTTEQNKKIIIYIYNSTPPQRLTFEDGLLTKKE